MIKSVLTAVSRSQQSILQSTICPSPASRSVVRALSVNAAIHRGLRRSGPDPSRRTSDLPDHRGRPDESRRNRPAESLRGSRQPEDERSQTERRPNHQQKHDVADIDAMAFSKIDARSPRQRAYMERRKPKVQSALGLHRSDHGPFRRLSVRSGIERGRTERRGALNSSDTERPSHEGRASHSGQSYGGRRRLSPSAFDRSSARREINLDQRSARGRATPERRSRGSRGEARSSDRATSMLFTGSKTDRRGSDQERGGLMNRAARRADIQRPDENDPFYRTSKRLRNHDSGLSQARLELGQFEGGDAAGHESPSLANRAQNTRDWDEERGSSRYWAPDTDRAISRPPLAEKERRPNPQRLPRDIRRDDRTSDERPFRRPAEYDDGSSQRSRPRRDSEHPLSIPYTTPASEFLYGTSVVTAALQARTRKMYKLYIYEGENREAATRDESIRRMAKRAGVEALGVRGEWQRLMDKMSTGRPHNGYVLEASPLPKLPVQGLARVPSPQRSFHVSLGHQSKEEQAINGTGTEVPCGGAGKRYPFILMLDGILDPGNFGAIVRSAYFLGVDAIGVSERHNAPFSPIMLKASAGSSEHMPFFSIAQPNAFLDAIWSNGWKLYAAVAPPSASSPPSSSSKKYLSASQLQSPPEKHPCVLMLGGEGEGLRWNLRKKVDYEVGIAGARTGQSSVDSLNVSVAAGILCQEFLRTGKHKIVQQEHSSPSESLF